MFRYYFEQYEAHTGRPHPPICASQIVRIIQDMPWIEQADRGSAYADIPPESYPPMIDQHFQTRYRRCAYNINHFSSGRIQGLALFMKRATKENFMTDISTSEVELLRARLKGHCLGALY